MKANDKVKVYIFGTLVEVTIFSLDSKYIYFTDPSLIDTKFKNRLYSRRIDSTVDIIISN